MDPVSLAAGAVLVAFLLSGLNGELRPASKLCDSLVKPRSTGDTRIVKLDSFSEDESLGAVTDYCSPCPPNARCRGGRLVSCRMGYYIDRSNQQCRMDSFFRTKVDSMKRTVRREFERSNQFEIDSFARPISRPVESSAPNLNNAISKDQMEEDAKVFDVALDELFDEFGENLRLESNMLTLSEPEAMQFQKNGFQTATDAPNVIGYVLFVLTVFVIVSYIRRKRVVSIGDGLSVQSTTRGTATVRMSPYTPPTEEHIGPQHPSSVAVNREQAQAIHHQQCVVCSSDTATEAFVTCGHLICCQGCRSTYTQMMSSANSYKCPYCRKPSDGRWIHLHGLGS